MLSTVNYNKHLKIIVCSNYTNTLKAIWKTKALLLVRKLFVLKTISLLRMQLQIIAKNQTRIHKGEKDNMLYSRNTP